MRYSYLLMISCLLLAGPAAAQDGLNQVIVLNSGQFGNPAERANLASFNPVTMEYIVFDTIAVNSAQHIVIEGDNAWVAAQTRIVKYDLDSYERIAEAEFPGVSAHQLLVSGDKLYATNFYGQTTDNLYIFNKEDLSVIDTVGEITHPGGTMAVLGSKLYISQNRKGAVDACPPFGCYSDTSGYVAVVDLQTGQWLEDLELDNGGSEAGRLFAVGTSLVTLNEVSNTATALMPQTGESVTVPVAASIGTSRYRTEGIVLGGRIVSLFDGGIGLLADSLGTAEAIVDTPVLAFAYDAAGDRFFTTYTDFFSVSRGAAFSGTGSYLFDFPVGMGPENIAVHYNRLPEGADFEVESADTVLIDVNAIATDPDGDSLVASRVENAPVNGVVQIMEDGSIRYVSLSPGSADAFRIEVCDTKLNPLCSFINVTILPVSAASTGLFSSTTVYPNPVRGRVGISNPVRGAVYEIFNSTGSPVAGFSEGAYDMKAFPAGVYFLRMSHAGDSRVFRIVKN